ncbi:MAG: tetratricopeptide repeat protein [Methylococcales bacterium]|jgi:TPR repeat protein
MKLLQTQKKLTVIAMALTIPLFLLSCSDDVEEKEINHLESIASKVEKKIPEKLQREALDGDIDAQYELAYMYENGLGVPKDEKKALELYQAAAGDGHVAAQSAADALSKRE